MKLKKLVLCGFKSFADRTEFDFDDGISCIVGPNGCGKSNVVDALKWVLGEQSAKSLRGTEMMDVVFNGSATRKASGSAEVTLVFDNADGALRIPGSDDSSVAPQISVTRRLYRGGQSDYLINKSPCRLRDIREMFMDTGVGVDAYSVIEQGRVESFLQASADDRRSIFDEAAGISKYKARRKEALRKLEHVEQNLLRLSDIVGEVEKRLRSIKLQAGKARNALAYRERLNELRSLHFLAQYHNLSIQRTDLRAKLDAQSDQLSLIASRIEQLESSGQVTELEAADLERSTREVQGRLAAGQGQITAATQRGDMLESRVKELGDHVAATTARCEELQVKIQQCTAEADARAAELQEIEARGATLSERFETVRNEHTAGELALAALAARLEDEKAGTIDLIRRSSQLHNEIHGLGIRRENLHSQRTRLASRAQEVAQSLTDLLTRRSETNARLGDAQEVIAATQARLEETREAGRKVISAEEALQQQLSESRERRIAVLSRTDALGEMQERLEGVAGGVRKVLQAKREGRLPAIMGMLGDFVETDVQHAPMVAAALAGADQQLLARSFEHLCSSAAELTACLGEGGTAEILCLDRLGVLSSDFDIAACPQALGRVIDWVRCPAELAPALWRLLGRTLAVGTLAEAAAAAQVAPEGYRFVTAAGEVLEADGRVRIGSGGRASGVVGRRSELADLATQQTRLDEEIYDLDRRCQSTRGERTHLESLEQSLRTAVYEATAERLEAQSMMGQFDEQIAKLQREEPLIAGDIRQLAADIDASVQAEHQAKAKAAELEQLNTQRQAEIARLNGEITVARSRQNELSAQWTEVKVELAGNEQKRLSTRDAVAALKRQRDQMDGDLAGLRSQIELNVQRRADAQQGIETARAEAARLERQQEALKVELADLEESCRGLREKLDQIKAELTQQRKDHEIAADTVNTGKVRLGEADVRIENLIQRANDEMSMNLMEKAAQYQHDDARDWAAVETEIAELKGKIDRLGSVNLDAIAEQEELEKRGEFLSGQLADVRKSQGQLDELIKRLNKESRELFATCFEVIRTNFQELFRKLFGGGKADILLLNPDDVLESEIDIVARPPGKETRSITLLSGGEKTMTALALLFSIFRSRPSPFCLLDEVDAALDEANNRRFNVLVTEFVADSQFIIISHSKRTMSMANVLYGVTMQEPGVSKRISVRFEEAGQTSDEQLQPA